VRKGLLEEIGEVECRGMRHHCPEPLVAGLELEPVSSPELFFFFFAVSGRVFFLVEVDFDFALTGCSSSSAVAAEELASSFSAATVALTLSLAATIGPCCVLTHKAKTTNKVKLEPARQRKPNMQSPLEIKQPNERPRSNPPFYPDLQATQPKFPKNRGQVAHATGVSAQAPRGRRRRDARPIFRQS
jgi:hypothetical protein